MSSIQGNIDKTWSNILDRLRSSLKMTEINIRKMSNNISAYEAKVKDLIGSLIKENFTALITEVLLIYYSLNHSLTYSLAYLLTHYFSLIF